MIDIEEVKNTIINADCMDILKQLPDKCVDLVLTDPPYKQEFKGSGISKNRPNYMRIKEYGSTKDFDYSEFFELSISKLKNINLFTFCDKETKYEFVTLAKKMGLRYHEVAFCKTSPTPFTNNQWLPDVEWGLHIFKDLEVMGDYTTKRSFFVMPNFKEAGIDHPTPKRVDIVGKILQNVSKENDLVFDPFSGSGTTAVVCHRFKRNFVCVEKDLDYWKASVKRLEDEQRQGVLF